MSRMVKKIFNEVESFYPKDTHLLPDLNDENVLHKNLQVTTITMNGMLDKCLFSTDFSKDDLSPDDFANTLEEQPFFKAALKTLEDDDRIYGYFSDVLSTSADTFKNMKLYNAIENIEQSKLKVSTSNKGRNKKDKPKKFFQSQTTISIISKKYPRHKVYNIKIFKPGNFGLPGVGDIDDAMEALDYWVNKMNSVWDREEKIKVNSVYISMCNYKTRIDKTFISLADLNEYLTIYASELNPTYDGVSTTNCVSLTCNYDVNKELARSNRLDFVSKHSSKYASMKDANAYTFYPGKNKQLSTKCYRIEIYAGGKIGVKGNCPYYNILEVLDTINAVLLEYEHSYLNTVDDVDVLTKLILDLPEDCIIYH